MCGRSRESGIGNRRSRQRESGAGLGDRGGEGLERPRCELGILLKQSLETLFRFPILFTDCPQSVSLRYEGLQGRQVTQGVIPHHARGRRAAKSKFVRFRSRLPIPDSRWQSCRTCGDTSALWIDGQTFGVCVDLRSAARRRSRARIDCRGVVYAAHEALIRENPRHRRKRRKGRRCGVAPVTRPEAGKEGIGHRCFPKRQQRISTAACRPRTKVRCARTSWLLACADAHPLLEPCRRRLHRHAARGMHRHFAATCIVGVVDDAAATPQLPRRRRSADRGSWYGRIAFDLATGICRSCPSHRDRTAAPRDLEQLARHRRSRARRWLCGTLRFAGAGARNRAPRAAAIAARHPAASGSCCSCRMLSDAARAACCKQRRPARAASMVRSLWRAPGDCRADALSSTPTRARAPTGSTRPSHQAQRIDGTLSRARSRTTARAHSPYDPPMTARRASPSSTPTRRTIRRLIWGACSASRGVRACRLCRRRVPISRLSRSTIPRDCRRLVERGRCRAAQLPIEATGSTGWSHRVRTFCLCDGNRRATRYRRKAAVHAVCLARRAFRPASRWLARAARNRRRRHCAARRRAQLAADGTTLEAQVGDALQRLHRSGWSEPGYRGRLRSASRRSVAGGGGRLRIGVQPHSVDAMPCGYSYAAIDAQGRARNHPGSARGVVSDTSGIPPAAGVMLLDSMASGEDRSRRRLRCLRARGKAAMRRQ